MHDEVNQLCESESHSVMSDSFAIPWTVAHQALSIKLSSQEYWSG